MDDHDHIHDPIPDHHQDTVPEPTPNDDDVDPRPANTVATVALTDELGNEEVHHLTPGEWAQIELDADDRPALKRIGVKAADDAVGSPEWDADDIPSPQTKQRTILNEFVRTWPADMTANTLAHRLNMQANSAHAQISTLLDKGLIQRTDDFRSHPEQNTRYKATDDVASRLDGKL